MTMINLPVFPLALLLLPQGLTRLRIFEARYLKMVSLAMKASGFVILPKPQQSQLTSPVTGSWVEIINFHQGDDGLLIIDVRCKSLVDISNLTQDESQLHHGDVCIKTHWPCIDLDNITRPLSTALAEIFHDTQQLSALYQQCHFESGRWVVSRWLELLPIALNDKTCFLQSDSYSAATQFLYNIILSDA
ncbi:hypothetical protein SAMN05216262_12125 [Colwellia chukchiensis]|uniref:Lon N-terminal domain-containing protein n=1 Tax=Colwellia chukchiensis TaxID=641665 RepID=A0A1H7SVW3_9GAMM|nr:LON peptidase substrate-binding domain-containing protein [Colwellia chukchiensis]SEL76588.1 hypothetical protein SAMN05216262_12125 [Colwellia chukchiensis]